MRVTFEPVDCPTQERVLELYCTPGYPDMPHAGATHKVLVDGDWRGTMACRRWRHRRSARRTARLFAQGRLA